MKYVYMIRSEANSNKTYIGVTADLKKRISIHNNGGSVHTAKYKPWKLVPFLGFSDNSKALVFERYLKTCSGRAFAKKRFW